MGNRYQYSSCYATIWNNIGRNVYVSTVDLLSSVMESNNIFLKNPCWWSELWSSNFNMSLVWLLNLFGVKVLISSIPNIQQATIRDILWKTLAEDSSNLFEIKFSSRTIVDAYFDFLESVMFFLNGTFIFFFLNLASWILYRQAKIREFLLKNPAEEIVNLSVK